MTRDPSRPIGPVVNPLFTGTCGYALDAAGGSHCATEAVYRFRLKSWPAWRFGIVCPEHAQVVRTWDVERMTSIGATR